MKRLLKHAPVILLLLHLIPPAAIHLLEESGYIILRRNDAWWGWFGAAVTAVAAIQSLIRKPEWNTINRIAAVLLLPMGCILDIVFAAGRYMNAFLPALICAFCNAVLFIRSRMHAIFKFPLALISCLAILLLFFGSFVGFGNITVLSSVSPDEKHIAFVEFVDEGALGGRVLGYVCEYHPDSLLDVYIRKGKLVMDCNWIDPDNTMLYWENDQTFVMDKNIFHIGELMK